MKRLRAVVDTNVPLIANRKASVSEECVATCARQLAKLMKGGHLVLDEGWRIIGEYQNKLSPSGQPGPGDAFLKWVLTNHANPGRCTKVPVTRRGSDPNDFEEFPATRDLVGFDPSDRKFVAVAASDPSAPPVWQGFDSKWWGFRKILRREGIQVVFLCEQEISAKHAVKGKKGRKRPVVRTHARDR